MSFTSVTLTGIVELQPGTPAPGAVVTLLLSGEMSDGATVIGPSLQSTTTASDGSYSIAVPANNDPTTTPTGRYYQVSVSTKAGRLDYFGVIVPYTAAPSVQLYTLPRLSPSGQALTYGVSSFDGRSGVVTLDASDVLTTALATPGGTTDFLRADGTWAVAGGVSSVFTRTGAVTAQTGDYTAAQVGALPSTDDLSAICTANAVAGDWSNNSHEINHVSDLSISGLTGAVAASRYVGATAHGAPTSGTFALGDFVLTQTGNVLICTAAGTPGTWTDASSLRLLASNNLSDVGSASTALSNLAGAPKASPTFTGTVTLPDASTWTSSGLTAGAAVAMGSKKITGLANPTAAGGALAVATGIQLATSSTVLLGIGVTSDTNDRFQIEVNGTLNWGPGNAGVDTVLSRTSGGGLTVSKPLTCLAGAGPGLTSSGDLTIAPTGQLYLSAATYVLIQKPMGSVPWISCQGTLGVGASSESAGSFGGATGPAVFLANGTGLPSGSPSGGGVLSVSSGALYWTGSSGTQTKLAVA